MSFTTLSLVSCPFRVVRVFRGLPYKSWNHETHETHEIRKTENKSSYRKAPRKVEITNIHAAQHRE